MERESGACVGEVRVGGGEILNKAKLGVVVLRGF